MMGARSAPTMTHLLSASASTWSLRRILSGFDLVGAQDIWDPGFIRGPGCKYYYVLLDFMSIHLLSLIYFTNDRVCYMQCDFGLPPGLTRELLPPNFASCSTELPI